MALLALLLLMIAVTATECSKVSTRRIPNLSEWPHRPVYLQASNNTKVLGTDKLQGGALPLGIPFEVDTPLFQGRILVRFRNAKSDDTASHNDYFQPHKKRLMQTVVQGRFKKPIKFSEVFVGSVFAEPIQLVPPKPIMKVLKTLIGTAGVGVILDLHSPTPKVLSLFAGAAQMIRADKRGEEPDIRFNLSSGKENIGESIGKVFRSIQHRQRHMNSPKKSARYTFDTDKIYTFHTYDDTMDYGTYTMKLPMYGNYKLEQAIGPQPMSLAAVTAQGETIFQINVWHESILFDDDDDGDTAGAQ